MKFRPDKKKSYLLVTFLFTTLLLILSNVFLQDIRTFLLMEAENSLKEISQQCSVEIKNELDSRQKIISSLANLEEISNADIPIEYKLNLLRKEAARNKFLRLGISDLAGNAMTSDDEVFNIADRAYFQQAKNGLSTLSGDLQDRIGLYKNESIIIHAVPIKNGETVIGVLFATDHTSHLTSLIQNIYFDPKKRALILTSEGKILTHAADEDHDQNFFDLIAATTTPQKLLHLKTLLTADLPGAGTYQTTVDKRIVGIAKIQGTQGWHIAVTAPQNAVMVQANNIMSRVIMLMIVVFLFICGVFIYFYTLNNKYWREKENVQLSQMRLQVKDAFLANVSHEIRTPLNAITGMTHLLKNTNLSPTQEDYLQKIETTSNVLLGIVNDILDMSKISHGQLKLTPMPFQLSEVVHAIDHIFADRIREKGLQWEIDAGPSPDLLLLGDKQRLIQILINLVNNAYKFTEQGKITLKMQHLNTAETSIVYKIAIKDTGIGIAPEDISRLFLPFEQLEGSLNKAYEGTGLGLCICQNLLHAMGSQLSVESIKGIGSTFAFSIAFPPGSEKKLPPIPKPPAAVPIALKTLPILLVEDNDINAEIAGALLDELSIKYEWVNNGLKAVEKCRCQKYSLILMDIHMPVLDGYAAAKIIKEDLGITTPIIALTATTLNLKPNHPETGYIDDYIPKPFNVEHVKQKLTGYLTK